MKGTEILGGFHGNNCMNKHQNFKNILCVFGIFYKDREKKVQQEFNICFSKIVPSCWKLRFLTNFP